MFYAEVVLSADIGFCLLGVQFCGSSTLFTVLKMSFFIHNLWISNGLVAYLLQLLETIKCIQVRVPPFNTSAQFYNCRHHANMEPEKSNLIP